MINRFISKLKMCHIYIALVGLSIFTSYTYNQIQPHCLSLDRHNFNQHTQLCKSGYQANKNWLAWISGGSRSAHFHFLDLIELLHSGN